jgi:hypothetical protein
LLRDFFIAGKFSCFLPARFALTARQLAGDVDDERGVLPLSISIICVNYFNIFRQYLKRPASTAILLSRYALRMARRVTTLAMVLRRL